MWAYYFAYILSLFRLPFLPIPYLAKLILFYCLKGSFNKSWNGRFFQFIRICGDFANFAVVVLLFSKTFDETDSWIVGIILALVIGSEIVRLTSEKGIMIFSAFWQSLPHRSIAR